MKTAVLTGATGFVGYALLNELIKNNIHVYVLCRPNSVRHTRLNGLPSITVIEVDLKRVNNIELIKSCDVFYHLAWGGERNSFDEQYINIGLAINSLKIAARLGCKRFIFTSSQAEYGRTQTLITEDTPVAPITSYGACKSAVFYLLTDLAGKLGVDLVWVRIFSVYGPNDNPNTLIINLIEKLIKGGFASITTNGEHTWNYIFEEDAAYALRMLGEKEWVAGVFNLASSQCKPLKWYIEEVKKIINPNAVITYGKEESEVNLNVSTQKLRSQLGDFENTSFTEGIIKTIMVCLKTTIEHKT